MNENKILSLKDIIDDNKIFIDNLDEIEFRCKRGTDCYRDDWGNIFQVALKNESRELWLDIFLDNKEPIFLQESVSELLEALELTTDDLEIKEGNTLLGRIDKTLLKLKSNVTAKVRH